MISDRQIRDAVLAVFTKHGEKTRIPVPAVQALASQILGATQDNYKELVNRISTYLRRSNRNNGKYRILSGKNGGVGLRAHWPEIPKPESFNVTMILSVPAKTYKEALQKAHEVASNSGLLSPDGIDGRGIKGKVVSI